MPNDKRSPDTVMQHLAEDRQRHHGAVVPPLYQTSLFTFEGWDAIDDAFDHRTERFIYSRVSNPTVAIAEEKLAALAGAQRAKLFASGMAAISAAILHCVRAGDHVVAVRNVYGPTSNLLTRYLGEKMGLEVSFVDGRDPDEFAAATRPNTRLYYLESPTSAVFELQDLDAIATLAKSRSITTICDNTWATPVFQHPLALGIDLEVHSCSKYLGGHSDIVAGVVMGSRERIDAISCAEYELVGGKMAPFDAWLLIRSLRTLSARMERHERSAQRIAAFLAADPRIVDVRYPGLASHPQHELVRRQMKGSSGLFAVRLRTDDLDAIKRFVDGLELFQLGVSWGGHESLIYAPAISYLKELPPERFASLGIGVNDLRLSIGLEDADDLIDDLRCALDRSAG